METFFGYLRLHLVPHLLALDVCFSIWRGDAPTRQLLKNPKVLFVGYRIPHPLEPILEIKVQTTADTTPQNVVVGELDNLIALTKNVKMQFTVGRTEERGKGLEAEELICFR